jgi:hypothetical protein
MKYTFLPILAAGCMLAASWDGTQGTITVSTTGDDYITVFAISTSDPTVNQFQVTVLQKCDTLGTLCIPKPSAPLIVRRVVNPKLPPMPSLAVFYIPQSQILSVAIVAEAETDSQVFGAK